jgi:hypothetical protein
MEAMAHQLAGMGFSSPARSKSTILLIMSTPGFARCRWQLPLAKMLFVRAGEMSVYRRFTSDRAMGDGS